MIIRNLTTLATSPNRTKENLLRQTKDMATQCKVFGRKVGYGIRMLQLGTTGQIDTVFDDNLCTHRPQSPLCYMVSRMRHDICIVDAELSLRNICCSIAYLPIRISARTCIATRISSRISL